MIKNNLKNLKFNKIYAGVIGSGIGLKHFEAIEKYQHSEVLTICEKDNKRISYLKKIFPNKMVVKNEDEIFLNKKINLVSIASYDDDHYRQILKCIKYNKNFIVEKPMCLKLDELKKINNLLKKSKVKIISNLVLRFNSLFNDFRNKIDKKKVYYIEADYIWGRKEKLFQWRSKVKDYSITLGAGIHMVDLIIWFLGKLPKSVTAYGNDIATKNSKFKKKSFAIYIFEFPKNIIVKITANLPAVYNHIHEVKIFQTNKTIINNLNGSFLINNKNKISKITKEYPDKKNRKKLIRSFIETIISKKKQFLTLQDQINLMIVCFAADKSLKQKKKIDINYKI